MITDITNEPEYMKDFRGFLEFISENGSMGRSILSPEKYCKVLNISLQELAFQVHDFHNTISPVPSTESVQKFLNESIRVIAASSDVSGDIHNAISWYQNEPLSSFEDKTAEKLVTEGRTEDLLRYIFSLEGGSVG